MDGDGYDDPEIRATVDNDESDACLYLNEMTQDVIEWDESNNKDLDQMFKSPMPPSSGRKGARSSTRKRSNSTSSTKCNKNANKRSTPSSKATTNSPLFLGVGRQLDPSFLSTVNTDGNRAEKCAEREIDGTINSLKMKTDSKPLVNADTKRTIHLSSMFSDPLGTTPIRQGSKRPAKTTLNRHHTYPKTKSSATSLAQRHRRRRTDYSRAQKEHTNSADALLPSASMADSALSQPNNALTICKHSGPTSRDGRNTQNVLVPKEATAPDDFAELLEAIRTPHSPNESRPLGRLPLSSVDENAIAIRTTTVNSIERKDTDSCSTEDQTKGSLIDSVDTSSEVVHRPQSALSKQEPSANIIPQLRHYSQFEHKKTQPKIYSGISNQHESPMVLQVEASHSRPVNRISCPERRGNDGVRDAGKMNGSVDICKHNKLEEFDNIDFSEDDLAKIDSLTQPALGQNNKQMLQVQSSERKNSVENMTKRFNTNENAPALQGNTLDTSTKAKPFDSHTTKRDVDEFGDFPSDIDFAQIDAMVSSQACRSRTEKNTSLAKASPQAWEASSTEILASSATHMLTSRCEKTQLVTSSNMIQLPKQNSTPEEEDEFGDFPTDIDFSEMDALVATQCCNIKHDDSKSFVRSSISTKHSNEWKNDPSKSQNLTSTKTEDDDYGDFPEDIDFDSLDQAVTQKMLSKPEASVDPTGIVRNRRRSGIRPREMSFMKFSRYKVLAVENDQKNCIKILKVAGWVESMMKIHEEEKKIHRDGKVKRSDDYVLDEDNSCSFSLPQDIEYPEDGMIYLCGEWTFTPVSPGDFIHVCSLTGQFETDTAALPIVLNSYPPPGSDIDDLILVLHPDMLLSPSIISEASSCNRRAALKSKLGSTGLSSKSAVVGTMRHGLFEGCMKAAEFSPSFAQKVMKKLIREKAEMLIGCNVSESEAEVEILNILPMIQHFAGQYTTLRKDVMVLSSLGKPVGGAACHPDIRLLGTRVHSVEENIVSAAIGLKGSIDAVLETQSEIIGRKQQSASSPTVVAAPQHSLMCFELKTGHNQNIQNVHMAQLSLYTFMLQSRYGADIKLDNNKMIGSQSETKFGVRGAAPGGILLYLNEKSQQISHVSPQLNEVKTLMTQRNVVASDSKRSSRLRGIALSYDEGHREDDKKYLKAKLLPAPPADLPELKASSHPCKRCFSNRECMVYAASDPATDTGRHHELLSQFTGHLKEEDLTYFRKWDRLIDIEADASNPKIVAPWLVDSRIREIENGESISRLVFDANTSFKVGTSHALVCFRRKLETSSQSPLERLNIAPGSYVILSTDGNIFDDFSRTTHGPRKHRNQMHVTKGYLDRIEDDKVFLSMTSDELNQVEMLVSRYQDEVQKNSNGNNLSSSVLFRLDMNTRSVGTGTLRWNLVNFLSGDYSQKNREECTELEQRRQRRLVWLRDIVIRLKTPEFADESDASFFEGIDLHISGCNLQELCREFHLLNDDQKLAVKKVLSGRDYTLIQGLPGTGKTSILGFLARLLVGRGRRVLITGYTHSAVDNIMLKLMEKGMKPLNSNPGVSSLVRIGQNRSCHTSVKPIMHSHLALEQDRILNNRNSCEELAHDDVEHPSATALKTVITNARIVGVSALSLPRSALLENQFFDVVIIDEAGQMNEPTALGALAAADSFVLVGDHKQLPPLVNSAIAESGGYGVSLLKKLAEKHPHAIAPLTMQYRMNEDICKISSESMYGGRMKCGDEKVKSQQLHLPGFPSLLPKSVKQQPTDWLRTIIDPDRPVVFVDTDNLRTKFSEFDGSTESSNRKEKYETLEGKIGGKGSGSIINRAEATLVRYIVGALQSCGHDLSEIGVISPFRAQIRVLGENPTLLSWKKEGLELSTIDRYQGRDKSTIILSLVRSNEKNNTGRLLQDARRLNVAFTRAKYKLIVIGSYRTLTLGSAPLRPILNRMNMRDQRVEPPENALGCYDMN